jgi:hypothetical protein
MTPGSGVITPGGSGRRDQVPEARRETLDVPCKFAALPFGDY